MDGSWWDPIGMRATVSHLVRFDRTFIPDNNFDRPSRASIVKEGWQTCFIPHYAATFLGAAEAAYEFALDYVADAEEGRRSRTCSITSRRWRSTWRRRTCGCGTSRACGRPDGVEEARLAGSRARHVIEHLAEETVKHCIRACGARSLNRPERLERIYRDLSFYVRHDNDDHVLAMIGKSLLGQCYDDSFYKP